MAFMTVTLILLIAVLALIATEAARTVMETSVRFSDAPRFWQRSASRLSENDVISCIFVLKHDPASMKSFEANLLDISTPTSKNYGHFLTVDQIKNRISPSSDKLESVLKFLASFSITGDNAKVSRLGDMVKVKMPVTIAEQMLNTEFARFTSTRSSRVSLIRAIKPYSLPSEIAEVVNLVDDIVRFPSIRPDTPLMEDLEPVSPATLAADPLFGSCGTKCSSNVNPAVLAKQYNFAYSVKSVAPGNSMSVAEFQYQYYDNKDLAAFSSQCGVQVSVNTTIGGNKETLCETSGCVEALLDIEYIGAIAYPIPLTVIYQDEYSLLSWVNSVISLTNPPLVHSVSYGNDEIQQTSVEYMESVNEQFMVTGSLGMSILFASGDQGVWGRTGVSKTFNPDFPASSPYVTAVGGTNFQIYGTLGEESVWNCGGGGFSNTFPQPTTTSADVGGDSIGAAEASGPKRSAALFSSRRAMPDWLATYSPSNLSPLDLSTIFAPESNTIFYPNALWDGHPMRYFCPKHASHLFFYCDNGVNTYTRSNIVNQLDGTTHRTDGYGYVRPVKGYHEATSFTM